MSSNYDETVKSRIDDITKDGPNMYTGFLEITDNMIEWGEADNIKITFVGNCPDKCRPYIELSDNSAVGFGEIESIHRFFTLGKTNENVTENTIGKYGKGGYKAIISMADIFELTTHFQGKTYTCGTNFRTMEYNNSMEPTIPLKITENTEGLCGSTFKVYFRYDTQMGNMFSMSELRRHIIRGYHDTPKDVIFSFYQSDGKHEQIKPNKLSPYNKYVVKKTRYLHYTRNKDKMFTVSDIKEDAYAVIDSYILKDMITKNELLGKDGNKSPGIDFYRNRRMCNTRYPISKIGNVGTYIQKGQMRGKRCHLTVKFTDKAISETKTFDDCIGVTTVKDIYEDDRMEKSIIEILSSIAEKCSLEYEKYIQDQKEGIHNYLEEIKSYMTTLKSEDNFINENLLAVYEKELSDFTEYKLYYYDETNDKIMFADSKEAVKEQKANGHKALRSNTVIISNSREILTGIQKKIKDKKDISKKHKRIKEIMEEKDLNENDAKKIYIEEKGLETLKQQEIAKRNKRIMEEETEKIRIQKEEEAKKIRIQKEEVEKKMQQLEERKKKKRDEETARIKAEKLKKEEQEKLQREKHNNELKEKVKTIPLEELQKVWIEHYKKSQ